MIARWRALAAAAWLVAAIACAADRVPVEPYFRHADYQNLKLSPSGKLAAGIVRVDGRSGLVGIDLAARKPGKVVAVNASEIDWFEWVNDERILFNVSERESGTGRVRPGPVFTVKPDGSELRVLARPLLHGEQQQSPRYTRFLSRLPNTTDVLVLANDANPRYYDVYRLDTDTGRKTLRSLEKPGNVVRWMADRDGALRVAVTEEETGGGKTFWRASESNPWQVVEEYKARGQRYAPVAFDGDGSLIVSARPKGDLASLHRFDPATKKLGETLAVHPQIDLEGDLVYDGLKKRVVGVRYEADRPGIAWFDEDWARMAASLDRALPGRFNVPSRSDGTNVLVYSYSDTDPGAYYLFDGERRQLARLVTVRSGIKPEEMPPRRLVRYPARDGLEIPAWLTLPRNREARNLPLVVYVHGGPWVRGATWAWHDIPAFLASQGYAVIEPEFRGSYGWGWKLHRAGWKQWGLAMQDDLDDGMDWLAKEGTIDPARACIMGGSYGGYAVMMGLARNPERWRCGIDYVGVTDIGLVFDVAWSDSADSTYIKFVAKDMIGDPVGDAAQLTAASPLAQAGKIRAPVLMAYGGADRRVPLIHGEKMRNALRAHDVPIEWVVYGEEGHGFAIEENRFDFYRRVAAFLDSNIGQSYVRR